MENRARRAAAASDNYSRVMAPRTGRAAAVVCGVVALSAWVIGVAPGTAAATTVASASASPAPPTPRGALPVQPVGGGACIIGLNCGCIRNVTCPRPHARRPAVPNIGSDQRAAPTAPPTP
jgi:hypothetical protein